MDKQAGENFLQMNATRTNSAHRPVRHYVEAMRASGQSKIVLDTGAQRIKITLLPEETADSKSTT